MPRQCHGRSTERLRHDIATRGVTAEGERTGRKPCSTRSIPVVSIRLPVVSCGVLLRFGVTGLVLQALPAKTHLLLLNGSLQCEQAGLMPALLSACPFGDSI